MVCCSRNPALGCFATPRAGAMARVSRRPVRRVVHEGEPDEPGVSIGQAGGAVVGAVARLRAASGGQPDPCPSGRPRGQTQIGHARPRWATQQQRQDDHRDAAVRRARAQKRPGAIEDSPRDGPAARWNEPDPAVRKAPSPERPAGRRCGQPSLTLRQALARVRPEGWRA
jgi:hypothetical protein